jgi:hypothetical protein
MGFNDRDYTRQRGLDWESGSGPKEPASGWTPRQIALWVVIGVAALGLVVVGVLA